MSAYTELLKHPKWQRRRLEIMQRDGFACTRCSADDKTLNVHHKQYRAGAAPWEYGDDELVTLCEDCHKAEHELAKLPAWAQVVCNLVNSARPFLQAEQLAEIESQLLISSCEIVSRLVRQFGNANDDAEVARIRALDEAWRLAHPDEAAAFDARKREQLERIRAWRPH